jgi:uncharacterized protein (TIGR02722 family)
MKTVKYLSTLVAILIILSGCYRSVHRVNPDEQIDLSGRWNDTDSKMVADEMSKDVLSRPWLTAFTTKNNKKPTLIVGTITNNSSEHIESDAFIKNIERDLINGGTVRIVENAQFREKMRQERADQQNFSSLETQKKWGKELGADYMMFGTITSITDVYNKKQVVYYQINLELADLETNEIVWIGEKKIKKFISN